MTGEGRDRRLLLLGLAASALLGGLLAQIAIASRSSLARGGQWLATKTTLERGVMGARNFMQGRQAVAAQRLNLGAWFGFQEVVYKRPLRPAEVQFDFLLQARAHLALIFDKTEDGFAGVRLSIDPARPSMVFTASPLGEFRSRQPFDPGPLEARQWRRLRCAFGRDELELELDGRALGRFPVPLAEPQQVGFRGGGRIALVQGVVIRERDGDADLRPAAAVYESFSGSGALPATAAAVAGVWALEALALWLLARRRPGRRRALVLGALVANGVLVAASGLLLALLHYTAERYPEADRALRASELAWRDSSADEVRNEIRARYPGPPAEGVARLLFVGSSQTWGAGAARRSETLVADLERMLNERRDGWRYECVNGGISAVDSSFLLRAYESDWARLGAKLVVVNLSNNDGDPALFATNLERLARAARAAGSIPLFVLEPNSPETRRSDLEGLAQRHAAMRRVAGALDVPLVDMHDLLLQEQDRGYLFWDSVHLTSFGQRLFAEKLYPEVVRLIRPGLLEDRAVVQPNRRQGAAPDAARVQGDQALLDPQA